MARRDPGPATEKRASEKAEHSRHRQAGNRVLQPPQHDHASAVAVQEKPADASTSLSGSLLGSSTLNGRGNAPVKVAMMQQMQQSYGNRAVQRFLQRQVTVSGSTATPIVARQIGIAPPSQTERTFQADPDPPGSVPIQRDDKPKPDTKTEQKPYTVVYLIGDKGETLWSKPVPLNENVQGIPMGVMHPLRLKATSDESRYEGVIEYEVDDKQQKMEVWVPVPSKAADSYGRRLDYAEFARAYKQHSMALVLVVDPSRPKQTQVDPSGEKDAPAPGQVVGESEESEPDPATGGKSSEPGKTPAGGTGTGSSTTKDVGGSKGTGSGTGSGGGAGDKSGSKYGFLGLLDLGPKLTKMLEKAFEAMGGTEEYLAILELVRSIGDLDKLLPKFKSLADPDKLLEVMLGLGDNTLIKELGDWVNATPTKKTVAATSGKSNALVNVASKMLKLLNATRKVLQPIFKIRAGSQKVMSASATLLEAVPEIEQLLDLSKDQDKMPAWEYTLESGPLMDLIADSASRAVQGKMVALRSGFAMRMEKLELITYEELARGIIAAIEPLVKWPYKAVVRKFKGTIADNLIAPLIPKRALDAINGEIQQLLQPIVESAEKLLDEVLEKIEEAVRQHLIPEMKIVLQRTPASKAAEFGKKLAPILTKGMKATKEAANDPTNQREGAKITVEANKLVTDKTVVKDSSPPKLPRAFGKEEVYFYKWKGGAIVDIGRKPKWAMLVPKLGIAGKNPKRIVAGAPPKLAKGSGDLKTGMGKLGNPGESRDAAKKELARITGPGQVSPVMQKLAEMPCEEGIFERYKQEYLLYIDDPDLKRGDKFEWPLTYLKGRAARKLGKVGEKGWGTKAYPGAKSKTFWVKDGRNAAEMFIPDLVTDDIIADVKNCVKLSFSPQLRAFYAIAKPGLSLPEHRNIKVFEADGTTPVTKTRRFGMVVRQKLPNGRPGTKIFGPLERALDEKQEIIPNY